MQVTRPKPEEFLKRVEEEEKEKKSGRLKIFFGYAAGVGKTYAMLQAAHVAKEAGIDVVAGYIEPHTRPETTKLLSGLEMLPPIKMEYRGIILNEFDLDGAIKRKPSLILVDELAHTNSDGCRHIKRYQDIQELLKAGIDVYTTVNVQHLESLNDIVASITGVVVRERIPDYVFDDADQVELIDIEPEELILRLNEGKVYKEAHVETALNNFFSLDNLIALREIALRRTADRVNRKAEKAKQTSLKADYYTEEHILNCISPSPSNARVIRTAARMANAFKGTFTALYVETPEFENMSEESKQRLRSNFKLAEQLGAKVATVYGDDVAFQIAEFARISGVSKVVIGRTNTKKRYFFSRTSFAERLTALAPNLDIYIIPDKVSTPYKTLLKKRKFTYTFSWLETLKSLSILAFFTGIGLLFYKMGFSEVNIITLYILGVLLTSITTTNKMYSLVASIFSVVVFNFFFTEPRFTLSAYDTGYPVTFVIMFLAAFITGTLTMKIKDHAKRAVHMAYRTEILLETNQMLQKAEDSSSIIQETAKQLIKLLDKTIIFYSVNQNKLSEPQVFPKNYLLEDEAGYIGPNERAVAEWVFKNNKHAGATTNTLHGAKCLYLAIRGNGGVYAVVGIVMEKDVLNPFENSLLISMLGECAIALEKDSLRKTKEQAAIQAQQEQLRANLLRSISHDLRTPLTSISGNASVLLSNADSLNEVKKNKLYLDIYDDSMWLINLVENLLSVTRIEDGTMNLHLEAELVPEVITEALRHVNRKSEEHNIVVEPMDDFIMAKMDSRLIIQVIINIVDNAIKYTPAGSTITISVKKQNSIVTVEIADDGKGISDDAKSNLFEMFYTANDGIGDSRRGLGLGLALCKSIIVAHGGTISVKDNTPSGAIFRFTLQAEEVVLHE